MLNITNYQRNSNQNYNEISPDTYQNGHHQKNLQTINAREGVVKREPSYSVGGSEIGTATVGNSMEATENRANI